jgi:ribosomal protein S18 acetylase RimI-like enzyme
MNNIVIEVLNGNDIKGYSKLINEVMEEFNEEEIDGFQTWFASVEGITHRRKYGFDDGSLDTVQFAAKHDGIVIGALEVENKEHIQSFFVKKEFQNKGIGKMLLNYSLEFFANNGIAVTGYSVLSSDYAVDIYKALGFKGAGKNLYLNIEHPEAVYTFFIGMKSSKWFDKMEGTVPWQEEPEVFSEGDNYMFSFQEQ